MKWLNILVLGLAVGHLTLTEWKVDDLEAELSYQKTLQAYLEEKSEFCAKRAANYAYVLDKKFYSEEGAQRIYQDCLTE